MVFTTLKFVVFMVIVFFLYYAIPKNKQWWLLLIASYVFYGFASPVYLVFLLFTTVVTYVGSIAIDSNYEKRDGYLETVGEQLTKQEKKEYKQQIQKKQKGIIAIVVVILLLMLGVFKYATFILENFTALLGIFGIKSNSFIVNIILPVGLSFYLFQSLGYCIDVYREVVPAERSFFKHALFVSYFPQLLQGPIGDYQRLAPQLFTEHSFIYKDIKFGLQRVTWGFLKKLVIANQISLIIDGVWSDYASYRGLIIWLFVAVLYAFQLYADFSGYMDIAVGCSQMLGITLDENFRVPYMSKNIAEYWRKWHITLGAWFRNYVFYSVLRTDAVDGIRKKNKKEHPYISNTIPTAIALLVVWTLIGLWHGADWSYVVHGLFHGSIIIVSTFLAPVYDKIDAKFPKMKTRKMYSVFQIARTFSIVVFGYLIFRPANLSVTAGILKSMVSGIGLYRAQNLIQTNDVAFFKIFIGLILLVLVDLWHYFNPDRQMRTEISRLRLVSRWTIYVMLLLLIVYFGAYGSPELNQFAYFVF